jgi:hypothetical protein
MNEKRSIVVARYRITPLLTSARTIAIIERPALAADSTLSSRRVIRASSGSVGERGRGTVASRTVMGADDLRVGMVVAAQEGDRVPGRGRPHFGVHSVSESPVIARNPMASAEARNPHQ